MEEDKMTKRFEKFSFKNRLISMIKLDFRRLFTSSFVYIIIGSCLIVPILILVMTKMMEGSPMTDQYGNAILDEFGNPILMEGFKNVWQMLGTVGGAETAMSMDLTSMCNVNMVFITITVLISIFVSQEFRSGYAKNLFTVRSNKTDYVISKTLIGFIGGMVMVISFFVGSLLGGAISGISFEFPNDVTLTNIIMCLLSKLGLVSVFASIFVLTSIIGKDKLWLSLVCGLGISMLLFMMISIVSPLNATLVNVILSFIGGLIFSIGLGTASKAILDKSRLV
jgi:ABC-type transport system involved in multi-copper enzyme maturation permease subunit